jgi:hypothetical protein
MTLLILITKTTINRSSSPIHQNWCRLMIYTTFHWLRTPPVAWALDHHCAINEVRRALLEAWPHSYGTLTSSKQELFSFNLPPTTSVIDWKWCDKMLLYKLHQEFSRKSRIMVMVMFLIKHCHLLNFCCPQKQQSTTHFLSVCCQQWVQLTANDVAKCHCNIP